jgi:hypothetical protein
VSTAEGAPDSVSLDDDTASAPEVTATQIGQLLTAFAARADDRADRPSYQQIKDARSLTSALRMADLLMTGIALDLSKVLREEYGLAFDADAWQAILGLPAVRRELQKQAEDTYGHAGCVDRAFATLAKTIRDSSPVCTD